MPDYQPPVGLVELVIKGGYEPPVGLVELILGPDSADTNRTLTVSGVAGRGVTGLARIKQTLRLSIAGKAGRGVTGVARCTYNINLLSAIHAVSGDHWRNAASLQSDIQSGWKNAEPLRVVTAEQWRNAAPLQQDVDITWRNAQHIDTVCANGWRDATLLSTTIADYWRHAPRLLASSGDHWRQAAHCSVTVKTGWVMTLPRLDVTLTERWQAAKRLDVSLIERFSDGQFLIATLREWWRQAGYPGNIGRDGPPLPPPGGYQPPVGLVELIICEGYVPPVGLVELVLGPHRCPDCAWIIIPRRRTYNVLNTASLVRLPDLVPLPCYSIAVETSFDSWCWSLTATLKTPDAWPLVQPNPLACEVRATINGRVWDFLLDVPDRNRAFNSDTVSLKGRSRAAWLHDPYLVPRDLSQPNARDMNQLAEEVLANTGWTVAWETENWSVPGGKWIGSYTPIAALLRLAQATADGVYTEPSDRIIRIIKRWPVKSWLLDNTTAAVSIPDAALKSLSQAPVYSPAYNGVYVSGTTAGRLALVRMTGTDGALQPPEPIIDELLCDNAGVAATQRGINALSDAGAGYNLQAEMLLLPTLPLIRPGLIVEAAGIKGISRTVRISAEWASADEGLKVFKTVGFERREIEP